MTLAAVLTLVLAAPPASGPPPAKDGTGAAGLPALATTERDITRAAEHFRRGTEAYVQGRYADAIDEFERSYRYSADERLQENHSGPGERKYGRIDQAVSADLRTGALVGSYVFKTFKQFTALARALA